jgi:hypothetical protein
MGKYQPIYKYTFLITRSILIALIVLAIWGPFANQSTIQDQLASSYEIEFSRETSLSKICEWMSQSNLPDKGIITAKYKDKTQNIVSYSFSECDQLTEEMKLYYGDEIVLKDIQVKNMVVVFFNDEDIQFPSNSPLKDEVKTKKLSITESNERFIKSQTPFDSVYKNVQEYRLYIFSRDGIPYKLKDAGHSWLAVVAMIDNKPKVVVTYSSWPGKDDNGINDSSKGQYFNVGTQNSIFVDNPTDIKRSINYFEGINMDTIDQTYTVFNQQQIKEFVILRQWFLPRFARPDKYQTYLISKFLYSDTITDRTDGLVGLTSASESALINSFWFIAKSIINKGVGDSFAYDAVVSNCTAYVATLWNDREDTEHFQYKFLYVIPAPSVLYRDILKFNNT